MKRLLLCTALVCTLLISGTTGTGFSQNSRPNPTAPRFWKVQNPTPEFLQSLYRTGKPVRWERVPATVKQGLLQLRGQDFPVSCTPEQIIWQGFCLDPVYWHCALVQVSEIVCTDGRHRQYVFFALIDEEFCATNN